MKKIFKILVGFVLFVCICFAGVFYLIRHSEELPTDQDLLANFEKNKGGFEELIKMIRSDSGLKSVDETRTRPQDLKSIGINEERIKIYREIFKKINIPSGFNIEESSTKIDLIVYAAGMVAAGASKGYSYQEVAPSANIVDNLDGINDTSPGDHEYFRHISGNWYLFFEFN